MGQEEVARSQASSFNLDDWEKVSENESEVAMEGMDDPFKDKWKKQEKKYYQLSQFSHYSSYTLKPFIVKANDDLR